MPRLYSMIFLLVACFATFLVQANAASRTISAQSLEEAFQQWHQSINRIFDDPNVSYAEAKVIAENASYQMDAADEMIQKIATSSNSFAEICQQVRPLTLRILEVSETRLKHAMLFGPDYTGQAPRAIESKHLFAINQSLYAQAVLAGSVAGLCKSEKSGEILFDWQHPYNEMLFHFLRVMPEENVVEALNISREITRLSRRNAVPKSLQEKMDAFRSIDGCIDPQTSYLAFLVVIQEASMLSNIQATKDWDDDTIKEYASEGYYYPERGVLVLPTDSNVRGSINSLIVECSQIEYLSAANLRLDRLSISRTVVFRDIDLGGLHSREVEISDLKLNGNLDLSHSKLHSLNVYNIRGFKKLESLDDRPNEWSALHQDFYGDPVPPRLNFYNSEISGDTYISNLVGITQISFRSSKLGPRTSLESIDGVNDVSLDRLSGGRVYLKDIRGDYLRQIQKDESRLEVEYAELVEFDVRNVVGFDNLDMYYSQFEQLYFSDVQIADEINYRSSSSKFTRIDKSEIGLLEFSMSNHGTLVLRDSRVQQFAGHNSEIRNLLYIENVVISPKNGENGVGGTSNRSNLEGIDADQVTLLNVCGPYANLDFGAARIGQVFEGRSIDLDSLGLGHSSGRSFVLFGAPIKRPLLDDVSSENDDRPEAQNAENLERAKYAILSKPWENCEAENDFKVLALNGAQFDEVRLSGNIEKELLMTGLSASRVLFNDGYVTFGTNAKINARDLNVRTLSAPIAGFRDSNGSPIAIDIMGSTFGILKWFEPGKDITFKSSEGPLLGNTAANCRFFDCILESALKAGEPYNYNPYIYRALYESAVALGMNSDARRMSIAKNDAYRAALAKSDGSWGEWVVYGLGKYINEYGYNNIRGFLWLLGLWVFGALVFSWNKWCHILRLSSLAAQSDGSPQGVKSDRSPLVYAIFGSLDRTIPSLGLDTEFGSTWELHPYQSSLLYLQRFLAFIVIAIILGGLFDFFQ